MVEFRTFLEKPEKCMQLNVKELSQLLNVTERTIYRWIKQQNIPFYRINDQYRFNRVEIIDWATAQKLHVHQGILRDKEFNIQLLSLAETVKKGGIYYRVEGGDKETVLGSVIDLLKLPEDCKKEDILDAMLIREELGSTALGDGIAIPHSRYPVVTHLQHVIISICFLENPIDYGAIDGKPVFCLITVVSPTVKSHLAMLSRIAFVLKDANVKDSLVNQSSREVIFNAIEKVEEIFVL